jgi:hypothetical protein
VSQSQPAGQWRIQRMGYRHKVPRAGREDSLSQPQSGFQSALGNSRRSVNQRRANPLQVRHLRCSAGRPDSSSRGPVSKTGHTEEKCFHNVPTGFRGYRWHPTVMRDFRNPSESLKMRKMNGLYDQAAAWVGQPSVPLPGSILATIDGCSGFHNASEVPKWNCALFTHIWIVKTKTITPHGTGAIACVESALSMPARLTEVRT